ncbi:hypothetical protein BC834DRAFT_829709 [Gloeopeniophorella convolvens]|nr:hypothetical protein BC834DRAFT_829709 [Gloeopeniophorella convolvens]
MPSVTKVALVTGAARGIGRAIALQLADDGFDVAVNDLPGRPELDEVATEIEKKGQRTLIVPADVSLEPQVEKMIQDVVEKLGSLDVMVANAGIFAFDTLRDITVETFDRIMSVNARGTMLCYKHAGKQMITQGRGGRIIGAYLLDSLPTIFALSYATSKFAIRGLTQAAALEFGKYNITVNAYAPGFVDTPMCSSFFRVTITPIWLILLAMGAKTTPVQRIAAPEEIAGLVSYVASEKSSFITGMSESSTCRNCGL